MINWLVAASKIVSNHGKTFRGPQANGALALIARGKDAVPNTLAMLHTNRGIAHYDLSRHHTAYVQHEAHMRPRLPLLHLSIAFTLSSLLS